MNDSFNAKAYIEGTSDSSRRTRLIMVIIVMASVLTLAGFLNSFDGNWMLERLRATMKDGTESTYFNEKFPNIPNKVVYDLKNPISNGAQETKPPIEISLKEQEYRYFLQALTDSYVNSSYTIRVPFFGITFDVNDLAPVGGLFFTILLTLYLFSLRRERDNLIISFAMAKKNSKLNELYNLLAMRQVLLVPPSIVEENQLTEERFLTKAPQYLPFFPFLVLLLIIFHDLLTIKYGSLIDNLHTIIGFVFSGSFLVTLLWIGNECFKVYRDMTKDWKKYANEAREAPAAN